jgi:hypothetical protein
VCWRRLSRSILATLFGLVAHGTEARAEITWAYARHNVTGEVIAYNVRGGRALLDDIVIGTHEDLQRNGYWPLTPLSGHSATLAKGASTRFDRPCEDNLISSIFGVINHAACVTTWDFAVVPYSISGIAEAFQANIEEAIRQFHVFTPVRFVRASGAEPNILVFQYQYLPTHGTGCTGESQLGRSRKPGVQEILLGTSSTSPTGRECTVSLIMHEIMHALGYGHEHQRPDRASYVTYAPENLLSPEYAHNFTLNTYLVPNTEYDYFSLMHYPLTLFAKPNTATLRVVGNLSAPDIARIGSASGFSPHDIASVYAHYGPPPPVATPNLQAAVHVALSFRKSAQSTVAPTSNYTGLWWNPSESGWGVNFSHQGDIVFSTLFTYDASGNPMWLVMSSGTKSAAETFSGTLFRTTGSPFNANPFPPIGPQNLMAVGNMTVIFSGDTATLNYSVNGVAVTKAIQKQLFGARAATCQFTTLDRSGLSNYQDLWWNSNESGWGLNIAHQGDILFGTLFTYNAAGQGRWYVMSAGVKSGASTYSGELFETHGPPFNAQPFVPVSPQGVRQVGRMELQFSSGTVARLTYSIDGVQVVKQITRQVFASPVQGCSG